MVLRRKLHMGKAVALCDWRRQLRAWRAWRAVVWAERSQREVARTAEQLRIENRQVKGSVLTFNATDKLHNTQLFAKVFWPLELFCDFLESVFSCV